MPLSIASLSASAASSENRMRSSARSASWLNTSTMKAWGVLFAAPASRSMRRLRSSGIFRLVAAISFNIDTVGSRKLLPRRNAVKERSEQRLDRHIRAMAHIGWRGTVERAMGIEPIDSTRFRWLGQCNHLVARALPSCVRFACEDESHTDQGQPTSARVIFPDRNRVGSNSH